MHRRVFLALLTCLLLSAPVARAQETAHEPLPRVALLTSLGTIVLEIDTVRAPVTAANFLRYVDEGRFNGVTFYRAMNFSGVGLIQGGTSNDRDRTLDPIEHEPTRQTGLTHGDGVISMARYDVGSATGDFFITVGDMRSLDADYASEGDVEGFAAFGRVVQGMEVVRAIQESPRSETEGEGVMRGQMLSPRIVIERAWRVED